MDKNHKEEFIRSFNDNTPIFNKIPSDCSFRYYERVTYPDNNSFILMDASQEKSSLISFMKVADWLAQYGLSAPKIFKSDVDNGYLLLEDFGEENMRQKLSANQNQQQELQLYQQATDLLVKLQQLPANNLFQPYNWEVYQRELMVFIDWYVPAIKGASLAADIIDDFMQKWQNILTKFITLPAKVVLLDYMADNIFFLENRFGVNSMGLIDFQDAKIGSPAYDLVSLLEDARRDVSPALAQKMRNLFLERTALPQKEFIAEYNVLGAQRNLKILGIFARKAYRDGTKEYLNKIPRVLGYLKQDLKHPALQPIVNWLRQQELVV